MRDTGLGDEMREHVVNPHLVERFGEIEPGLVLDIGCGDGYVLRLLGELGWRGIGFDWAEDMVRGANGTESQSFLVADAEQPLPFRNASFDAVVSSMVLMDLVDIRCCAHESLRVVRPGGIGEFIILHPEFVAREAGAIYEIADRHTLPPPAEWRAWVRIAPDQPASTLYVQRPAQAYVDALTEAGWAVTSVRSWSARQASGPALLHNSPVLAIRTRVPGIEETDTT